MTEITLQVMPKLTCPPQGKRPHQKRKKNDNPKLNINYIDFKIGITLIIFKIKE